MKSFFVVVNKNFLFTNRFNFSQVIKSINLTFFMNPMGTLNEFIMNKISKYNLQIFGELKDFFR